MAVDDHVTDPSLAAVLETSKAARDQALALVDLVAQASAATGDGALPADVLFDVSKQQKLLNTNLAQLRGLHRTAHFRARDTKSQTAEARHEVDVLHLQLQNLYYEQRHLEGEIGACESFDHTYQSLPLVPVDEFLAAHPEHADADEDALMTARINQERVEREALEQQRLELQKRKQKLIAENKKRRDDLANLDKDLEKFIDAAKPIQQLFEKVA
ncbi:Fms-interacting protein-domain-containing protein [Schizothecium vesticola]|uniref:Fms-interacting protein-domain-containing protein n=1 Tax=Schizothecium vesticola TaxID=314040 RepID=A0AA40K539_9PEZI|nr:Fms-interacting protein-domain-containing protein [Schizothecium vesticola]